MAKVIEVAPLNLGEARIKDAGGKVAKELTIMPSDVEYTGKNGFEAELFVDIFLYDSLYITLDPEVWIPYTYEKFGNYDVAITITLTHKTSDIKAIATSDFTIVVDLSDYAAKLIELGLITGGEEDPLVDLVITPLGQRTNVMASVYDLTTFGTFKRAGRAYNPVIDTYSKLILPDKTPEIPKTEDDAK